MIYDTETSELKTGQVPQIREILRTSQEYEITRTIMHCSIELNYHSNTFPRKGWGSCY